MKNMTSDPISPVYYLWYGVMKGDRPSIGKCFLAMWQSSCRLYPEDVNIMFTSRWCLTVTCSISGLVRGEWTNCDLLERLLRKCLRIKLLRQSTDVLAGPLLFCTLSWTEISGSMLLRAVAFRIRQSRRDDFRQEFPHDMLTFKRQNRGSWHGSIVSVSHDIRRLKVVGRSTGTSWIISMISASNLLSIMKSILVVAGVSYVTDCLWEITSGRTFPYQMCVSVKVVGLFLASFSFSNKKVILSSMLADVFFSIRGKSSRESVFDFDHRDIWMDEFEICCTQTCTQRVVIKSRRKTVREEWTESRIVM